METRLSIIFKTTNVTNLTKVIQQNSYRVLQVTSKWKRLKQPVRFLKVVQFRPPFDIHVDIILAIFRERLQNHTFQKAHKSLSKHVNIKVVVHFLNAFWHGKEAFPKSNSQNEIISLLIVFHLPYSKYKGVKICFYSCRYQNQNFSLVSHWCRSYSSCVVLVSHSCRSCLTRVALVSLVSHSCCILVARVWHWCCKLGQITFNLTERYILETILV